MADLISVSVQDNQSVLVEASELDDGVVLAARPGAMAVSARESLDEMLTRIQPVVRSVGERLRSLPDGPQRISLEFGVKLSAEAGLVIAKATTEAHLVVTVEWQPGAEVSREG
jgi:hypothetical protein